MHRLSRFLAKSLQAGERSSDARVGRRQAAGWQAGLRQAREERIGALDRSPA